MAWQTLRLFLIVYLLLFIVVAPLLLNADCVWPTKPASWLHSLSGIGLGTEEGGPGWKKSRWVSMRVWGLCHESSPSLVLGGIPRGGLEEVRFGRVGKQGCG